VEHRDVLIIGGGPAGRVIVHALHQADADLRVALIKDEVENVNRCAVPYGISRAKPLDQYMIPNALVTDYGAELIFDRVERIEPEDARVVMGDGRAVSYGNLILATGARPIIPPIPGIDAMNIVPVRSGTDLERLRELAEASRRAVVVGGGYIGVEVAVVLRTLGLEVSMVEMLPHIMHMTTEPEFISALEEDVTSHGVHLVTGAKVVAFARDGARATAVRLEDGRELSADFVVLAIGVTPNTELAAEAGLATTRLGIVTDDHLRTSVPNIYAAGDCAEKRSFVSGLPTRGEFGTNAVFMAKVVARNLLGEDVTFPGVINASATTTFNYAVGAAGLTEQAARDAQQFEVVTGLGEVLDKYPMMEHASAIRSKLVFDATSRRLLGGSVLRRGHGAAANIDFISFAIQMRATAEDIVHLQYATHPELAAKPSDNLYVFAARQALQKMKLRNRAVAMV